MSISVNDRSNSVALVTGGSAGLGRALVRVLDRDGWRVVTDARDGERLAAADLGHRPIRVAGDLRLPAHLDALTRVVKSRGRLDLLVHNASALGPMLRLDEAADHHLADVFATNVEAPLRLTRRLLPLLSASGGVLVSISSDAAVEHYPTWGLYGASKAALDHLTLTLAEETGLSGYAVDPGDMRTAMHQQAFAGEDITDRPLPERVVPHLRVLFDGHLPSGRYRAADLPLAHDLTGSPR